MTISRVDTYEDPGIKVTTKTKDRGKGSLLQLYRQYTELQNFQFVKKVIYNNYAQNIITSSLL
jgi:hypothetical protein